MDIIQKTSVAKPLLVKMQACGVNLAKVGPQHSAWCIIQEFSEYPSLDHCRTAVSVCQC